MTNEEELMGAENAATPQKRKRTRIQSADAVDHVYNADGQEGENLDQPKKRRGRPKKAETLAREAEEAQLMQQASVDESIVETSDNTETTIETEQEETEAPVKKRRGRRTKAEIMAAAEAKAQAYAQNSQLKASQQTVERAEPMQQELEFPEEEKENSSVPEASFDANDSENDSEELGLLAQLQNKVNAMKEEDYSLESVWEEDPGDGTDFIIIEDLPVEDNAAIPYYDMFDKPQMSANDDLEYDDDDSSDAAFDFDDVITANGVLEIIGDGYGFLRSSDYNYLSSPDDVHLTMQQIRQYSLKTGDVVQCRVRPPKGGEKYFTMSSIVKVNGRNPSDIRDRISFENLTPLFPDEKFNLCGDPATTNISTRIVDLFSPIGKGQRSLIVAQPKTGKTILMKDIANAIAANHPEAYIMMLLIDERPEEVTDMARTVNAEVVASTFDEPADRHVKIAGLVLEKAKRMVECGHDVVIFLDSITRLARAYNTVAPASGKVLTGGVDANALQKPKRFFGAARNIEGGGSLTIIATALTDTGSKMDEVIFEEFKGTGNSELQLDRQLANKRIFPAVNLVASSTRRDDLLQDPTTVNRMWILRKHIGDMNAMEAMNEIHGLITRTRDNDEFLMSMNG
ncbi:MAG: transcription termination factor Rho [Prevotella sp.]|nr:transcription termination factor Rho [Candidatus Prevotella equi]